MKRLTLHDNCPIHSAPGRSALLAHSRCHRVWTCEKDKGERWSLVFGLSLKIKTSWHPRGRRECSPRFSITEETAEAMKPHMRPMSMRGVPNWPEKGFLFIIDLFFVFFSLSLSLSLLYLLSLSLLCKKMPKIELSWWRIGFFIPRTLSSVREKSEHE